MTADDFAARICAQLIRAGELAEDSRPHYKLHDALKRTFPDVWAGFAATFARLADRLEAPVVADAIRTSKPPA